MSASHSRWIVLACGLALIGLLLFGLQWINDPGTESENPTERAEDEESPQPRVQGETERLPDDFVSLETKQLVVCGRTFDPAGDPLTGMGILLALEDGTVLARGASTAQGAFSLRVAASSPPRFAIVDSAGWMPEVVLLPRAAESAINVGDLVIDPAGLIQIRVTTTGGPPPASLSLALLDEKGCGPEPSGQEPASLHADPAEACRVLEAVRANGEERSDRLPLAWAAMPAALGREPLTYAVPAGTWLLRLETEERPPFLSDPFEISRGSTTRLSIELPAAGSISGICRDLLGAPVENVLIKAAPVLMKDSGDYTVLQEHLIPARGGATQTKIIQTRSAGDGTFRFAPLPEGFWYEIWSSDPDYRLAAFSAKEMLDVQIVPVGTADVVLVLDKVPELILTIAAEDGSGLGPGPGNTYISVELGDEGWHETFLLQESVSRLPLRMNRTIPEGENAAVTIQAFWEPDLFGETKLELPWHARTIAGTVYVRKGFTFDLGSVPFSFSQLATGWMYEGRSRPMSIRLTDEALFPKWSSPWSRPLYIVDRDDDSGSYRICSNEPGLEWAVLWERKYGKLLYLRFRPGPKGPERAERKIFEIPEKIVFSLDDPDGRFAGMEILGSVEARIPGRCGGRRLAYWGFKIVPEPGAAPVIWPSQAYSYKPAPGAAATLWRPRGIHCRVKVRATRDERSEVIKLIEEEFVLAGPKEFRITMP